MKKLFVVLFLLPLSIFAQKSADLDLLISYLNGHFSSEAQAQSDSSYYHITLDMQQIWTDNEDGAWMYVEQTAAKTPGKPYRQRVYHLQMHDNNTFSSTIYSVAEPKNYIGGHNDPEVFKDLKPQDLTLLEGCALKLEYAKGIFKGSTVKGKCLNSWGEATYATSEVEMSKKQLISWDRGWNDKDEQVWGAEKGGYIFIKQ